MVLSSSQPAFRLPLDIVPKHYDLDIVTNLGPQDFSFQGHVCIKVAVLKATNVVKVHARDLVLTKDEVAVYDMDGVNTPKSLPIASTSMEYENEFFVINTQELLEAGRTYDVHLPFKGQLKEDLIGYYRSSYFDHTSNSTKWLAVTHFEPSDARQAFPCFDEPAMKATFAIRLAHKDNLKGVSNMPLKSTKPFGTKAGWVWDEFETTVPMSTYLVAYMVSEFESCVSETSNRVQFRVWARRDAAHQTKFASNVGPHFLSFYEDFFNVKYPLPKQDLLAIPDFKIGAMENWGIITFRETALLLDENVTSSASKLAIANIIAHELAHMWFGNLVTMQWWTDLWLKEGFATYMASINVHHEFPEWKSLDASALDDLLNVFRLDALKSSHPVSVPIGHPREISQIFDAISYDKGSFLLRMMSLFLGEQVFRQGVSEYLKKHQFKNAEQDDLWASLTEQAHRYHALPAELTVKQIMDTWTLQTGYPVLTVVRNYENRTALVSQKRYLAVNSDNPEDYSGRWWVPLSFSTSKHPQFNETQPQHWLSKDSEATELHNDVGQGEWFILNNRAAGLYKVNYDLENWSLLATVLNSRDYKTIDPLNRAQLLVDAMDLAQLGLLNYNTAFSILRYLRNETSLLPWKAGLDVLNPIKVILSRTANYGIFKKFMKSMLTPIVGILGDLTVEPQGLEEGRLLSLIAGLACPLGVAGMDQQASELYRQWSRAANPDVENPIPKDVRKAVYSHAVRKGGEEVWEFLWQRYKNANLSSERNNAMVALASTQEIWLLNRYLEWSLEESSGIRKQDAFIIFGIIARHDIGFYVAQKFFYRNIKRISNYFGAKSNLIGRYFTALTEQMVYPNELEELRWFADTHAELLAPASLAVSQAIESVQVNINWMNNHYSTVSAILEESAYRY